MKKDSTQTAQTIALIVIIIWLVTSYTDIKSGIIDGWNGK